MTDIRFTFRKTGVRMVAEGHTGMCDHGGDPVCGMVSALVYMLSGYCYNYAIVNEIVLDNGKAVIDADGDLKQVGLAFVIGIKQVQKSYPDAIKMNVKGLF